MTTATRTVSASALVRRINRGLARRGYLRMCKCREGRWRHELGDYYVIDANRNFVVDKHADPEALGRELGVLRPWEGVKD